MLEKVAALENVEVPRGHAEGQTDHEEGDREHESRQGCPLRKQRELQVPTSNSRSSRFHRARSRLFSSALAAADEAFTLELEQDHLRGGVGVRVAGVDDDGSVG